MTRTCGRKWRIVPQVRSWADVRPAYRSPAVLTLRSALPVVSVVLIVAYADIRIPMRLPGHRGLVWLTLLVAVVLLAHRRATVVAVGAAATIATLAIHLPTDTASSMRYLTASILLYSVAVAPVARRRPWLVVLAAAPIHLVGLVGAVAASLGRGYLSAFAAPGLAEKALWHLGFGLVAGLLGWVIASAGTDSLRIRG